MNPDLVTQDLEVESSPVGLSSREKERNVNIGKVVFCWGEGEKILCKWQKKRESS